MNLAKSILHLQFDSASEPWLAMRALLRSAAADPNAEIRAAPLVVDRQKERKRIVLQVRAVQVEHELAGSGGSIKQAASEALKAVNGLHEASPFPSVSQMMYDVVFIEPFVIPFHDLVGLMKARYLRPSRISDVASDIALVFDQHEDGVLKHVQMGPMDKTQLQSEYLRWPAEGLPETFVFLGLNYKSTTEATPFSRSILESFLQKATEWQVAEAHSMITDLKEGG